MVHLLRHVQRRAAGAVLIVGEAGTEEQRDTLMCAHCQMHWIVEPGSGRARGWCFRCGGPTCGKQPCEAECVPWEKMIEQMEARGRLNEALDRIRSM